MRYAEACLIDTSRPSHSMPLLRLCKSFGWHRYATLDGTPDRPSWIPSEFSLEDQPCAFGDFRASSSRRDLPCATWDAEGPMLKLIPKELSYLGSCCVGGFYHPLWLEPARDRAGSFDSLGCSVAFDRPDLAAQARHFSGSAALPEEDYLDRVLHARHLYLSAGVIHCQLALNFGGADVTLVAYGNDQADNLRLVQSVLRHSGIFVSPETAESCLTLSFRAPQEPLCSPITGEAVTTIYKRLTRRPYA